MKREPCPYARKHIKYKPEFKEKVTEMMGQGYTLEAVAGALGVTRQTIWTWKEEKEDFREAYEEGLAKSHLYWERLGMDSLEEGRQMNSAVYIFTVKNKLGWRDKTEVENTGPAQKLVIDMGDTDGKDGTE